MGRKLSMELHQLQYVVAVDKYQHFSLAAESINVSQPTLSHQIKKLEKELGVELFVRTTRSVKPTPAGKEFIVYAKRILADVENAKNAMLSHIDLNKGHLKIGVALNITYLGITSLIAQFKKQYPGIEINLWEESSEILLKKIDEYEIDVAFVNTPFIPQENFTFHHLFGDQFVLLVSRGNKLAKRKNVPLALLAEEKFILYKKMGAGTRQEFIRMCHEAGFQPDIIFESSFIDTMKGLVEEGVGSLLCTKHVALSLLNEQTAIVQFEPVIKRHMGFAVSTNLHPAAKAFKDFILANKNVILTPGP